MFGLLGGLAAGAAGGGGGLPGLSASQQNDARATSGSSGAIISGGQRNGPPWYVWAGAGLLALVWMVRN